MIKVMICHLVTKQVIKTELVCRPNFGDMLPLVKESDKVVNVVFVTGLVVQQVPDTTGCDLLVYVE